MTVLETRNLRYTGGGARLLTDVSLRLEAGECALLLGPNGAGKSTLLRVLAGELAGYSGEVALLGRPLPDWHRRRLAQVRAVMPQHCTVPFPISVAEVVDLGLPETLRGRARTRIRDDIMQWLDVAGLARRIYPTLSGGEQQRVQLARVLAQIWTVPGPRLLLLDECTSALDPAQQHRVMAMLRVLTHQAGIGLLATTHDLALATTYADRVLLMRCGRVVADAAPREALTSTLLAEVYGLDARVEWRPRPSVTVLGCCEPPAPVPCSALLPVDKAAAVL